MELKQISVSYTHLVPPGFKVVAHTDACPVAGMELREKNFYGVQFHPEVVHTKEGTKMLSNFVYKVCGCAGDWKMDSFVETTIKALREKIGDGKVLCALSGGVDSSVAAVMSVSYTHLFRPENPRRTAGFKGTGSHS